MLALIVIVCLTAITAIGTKASTTFQNAATSSAMCGPTGCGRSAREIGQGSKIR